MYKMSNFASREAFRAVERRITCAYYFLVGIILSIFALAIGVFYE